MRNVCDRIPRTPPLSSLLPPAGFAVHAPKRTVLHVGDNLLVLNDFGARGHVRSSRKPTVAAGHRFVLSHRQGIGIVAPVLASAVGLPNTTVERSFTKGANLVAGHQNFLPSRRSLATTCLDAVALDDLDALRTDPQSDLAVPEGR